MDTGMVLLDRNNLKEEQFEKAAELLRNGELVAFPTETVYGLGGNALDPGASAKIYAAKGRPSDNPLIVHICDTDALPVLAKNIPESAWKLADRFWPGPMTMILEKQDIVPKETTGGLNTIAIRMPSDPIAAMLIKVSGLYIAAPSANASGRPSTTKASHVYEDLNGRIAMILDGGSVQIGLESTIIDLTGEKPLILRPGYITLEDVREILPDAEYDPAVLRRERNDNIVAKAPGMKYRHYAPKGQLTIFEGNLEDVVNAVYREAVLKQKQGFKTAVLASEETKDRYPGLTVLSVGNREDEEGIAACLFDTLREFDHMGAEFIFGECFRTDGVGQAVMNRLLKAAGYRIESAGDKSRSLKK
ncbi:MAG: threonylcarbamoyl-AMP synthase [Lachnospiraceae bacterium]|nr:threonylcarbamoyl-AMP synthase [Lachnospiraceae bacterium]